MPFELRLLQSIDYFCHFFKIKKYQFLLGSLLKPQNKVKQKYSLRQPEIWFPQNICGGRDRENSRKILGSAQSAKISPGRGWYLPLIVEKWNTMNRIFVSVIKALLDNFQNSFRNFTSSEGLSRDENISASFWHFFNYFWHFSSCPFWHKLST